ncbi:MAG: MFS transporter, partial [Ktedonobacteraceae bacterium]|nr:MFS transporter [Ktedonobacteraceae bacterium]
MQTTTTTQQNIPARIDRLPISREILWILLLAGIAWLLESYDIGVIGTVLPTLRDQFQPDTFNEGLLAVASTLGIVVSVIPAGWLADKFGRKNMLALGTAWYALFSMLCAFAPNVQIISLLRFISGFGMGAIFPIPYAMAAEFTPGNARGMMTAILDSFLSVGYFVAPLLGFAFASWLPTNLAWRGLFLIGGLPLFYVPVLLKWMPESPRWLQIRGRSSEADYIVTDIETAIERRSGAPLPSPRAQVQPEAQVNTSIASIFQKQYLRRTIMMWISFACILFIFYSIQTFTPSVLVDREYGLGDSFLYTSIIVLASIPGK